MTKGRPPATKPATAFERRRYVTLTQIIATSTNDEPIRELCALWGVEPVEDRSIPAYRGRAYLNVWATIKALAESVIEYHKEEM